MKKELQKLADGPYADIDLNSLRVTLKIVPNRETPSDNGILSIWVNALKKLAYSNGWRREKLLCSKNIAIKEPYPATIDR